MADYGVKAFFANLWLEVRYEVYIAGGGLVVGFVLGAYLL